VVTDLTGLPPFDPGIEPILSSRRIPMMKARLLAAFWLPNEHMACRLHSSL
jgi:hypothetical protein